MSYIDYKSKEDIQDDTFKQIALLNWNCMVAVGNKELEPLVSALGVLYLTCWKKLGSYLPDDFERRFHELEGGLYAGDPPDDYEKSRLFDRARFLYKDMAGGLSDAGLLFRATINSEKIGSKEEL